MPSDFLPTNSVPLPTRPLGSTGITVPVLGLGTVKLGRNNAIKYPTPFDLPSDEQAIELLNTARSLGINLLDTAPAYALAEQRLGQLLQTTAALGTRDAWTIATKAGESFDPHTAQSHYDFSPTAITASIHQSLRHLRTDHLDIALIHSNGDDLHILNHTGALDALQQLKAQGLIRAVGISTKTPEGALLAVERCDVVMLTINPHHHDDEPAAARAAELGVGVLVKKALLSGHVGGSGGPDAPTPEACLRHALGVPGVSAAIVGTINPAHLKANARAAADTA